MKLEKVKQQARGSFIYTSVLFVISLGCLLIWGLDWRFYVSGAIGLYFLFDALGEVVKAKDIERELESLKHQVPNHVEKPELFKLGEYDREGDICLGMYVPFNDGYVFLEIEDEKQTDVILGLSKQLTHIEAQFNQFKLELLQEDRLDKEIIDTLQINHIGFFSTTEPDFGEVSFEETSKVFFFSCSFVNLQFKDFVIDS